MHAPFGPVQRTQQARISRILRSTGAQARLTIGQPNDRYEQEADRVADQVMAMPDPKLQRRPENEEAEEPVQAKSWYGETVQRLGRNNCPKCEEEMAQRQPVKEEDEEFQAKEQPGRTPGVTPNIESRINGLKGGGQPLDAATRSFFEPRFGRDFSDVRVHTDSSAADTARSIHARAFTLGNHVAMGSGEYQPNSQSGKRLLGHELTHVVQQGANGRVGHCSQDRTRSPEVGRVSRKLIQRAPLPVTQIRSDIEQGKTAHPDLLSWVQILGEQTGNVAHAADFPGGRPLTSMPSPVPPPDPQPVPTVTQWPIEAYFFPAHVQHTDRRALIMGGFHGDERPGYEMVETFVARVRQGQVPLAFHTLVIPRLNRGAIEDNLSGVTWYDRRCNRQFVDLNRNYRVPGAPTPSVSSRCPNTHLAPIQPETQGVINVIQGFQPHRVLTGHAVGGPGTASGRAGIFADPNTHPTATQLALAMAGRLTHASDRPWNRLGTRRPRAVYPGDRPGHPPSEPSLGRYAPAASRPGHVTPVITIEAPGYGSLATRGRRSRAGYATAIAAFVAEPSTLTDADRQIVRDIQAMTIASRVLFLTGRMASTAGIYRRIRSRINNAVRLLNGLHPRRPVPIGVISPRRAFGVRVGRASAQAKIVFEKFTLTGGRANGWDTLPNRYFLGGNRSRGVNRAAWLAEPSARRLQIILEFSAIPGASRHHWGTDVDFNSTRNSEWERRGRHQGRFYRLGQWLERNGPRVGLFRAYTAGRTGGHAPEPWHYSYEPIARPLRETYNRDVRLQKDIVDPIMHDWRSRTPAGVGLPSDLRAALLALDLSQYVNRVGPGL